MADTNRDGRVNASDNVEGKGIWTAARGALFLPNIGDTDRRCSKLISLDTSRPEIDDCHDASDNVLRNADFLAPLLTLPIPISELTDGTHGSINVTGLTAAQYVRVFAKRDQGWEYVSSNTTFGIPELAKGLELGIDARDVRRPGGWDGWAKVHFTVHSPNDSVSDSVALRVAPVLMHHHAQAAERVFTIDDDVGLTLPEFNQALRAAVKTAGITEPVYGFADMDKWVQDWFEPAYASIPGPDGPVVIRIMVRSFQNRRSGGQVFTDLRAATIGAAQHIADGDTIDSTGNLETIPPYTYNGQSYPAGRAIMGSWNGRLPYMFDFLRAQELQDPVELDTTWLIVGHVDEFVQFLPAPNTERGWVIMADDPLGGLELLRNASEAGHGDVPGLSRKRLPTDPDIACLPNMTLNAVLELANLTTLNEFAAERINYNLDILKKATGVSDDEIFRVPALFYNSEGWNCVRFSELQTRADEDEVLGEYNPLDIVRAAGTEIRDEISFQGRRDPDPKIIAHYPAVINGVVLSGKHYLAPDPWGPIVDGKDIIAEAVRKAYAEAAGYEVIFMDDWFSHHMTGGEIHCGTNVWRNADDPWW